VSRFDPTLSMRLVTAAWLPAPMPRSAMTEAMPTTMPRIVRKLRTLLELSE